MAKRVKKGFRMELPRAPADGERPMTPAWDWARFDALRAKLRSDDGANSIAQSWSRVRLRGRVADARYALENGQPVTMHKDMPREELVATTPDGFVDAWEQGWRP